MVANGDLDQKILVERTLFLPRFVPVAKPAMTTVANSCPAVS